MDHSEVVRRFYEGSIQLGVDRPGARGFFTELGLDQMGDLTGEVPFVECFVVRGAFWLAPFCLLGSLVSAVLTFHWWALLADPVVMLLFMYWWGTSPMANRRLGWSAALLAAAITSSFASTGTYLKLWLILACSSFFLIRFTYSAATFMLRSLVVRNPRAYQLCVGRGIVVVRECP